MHNNIYTESFPPKNRAGAVMEYRMRIYKKSKRKEKQKQNCNIFLIFPEATFSFAGILYKYILKSKATTPNSPSCLLNSLPNYIHNPGNQFHSCTV